MRSILWSTYAISVVRAASRLPSCRVPPFPPANRDIVDFLSLSYDYIIIGGGTAGLTVGTRLAEEASINVGIIEAGAFRRNDDIVNIPGLVFQGLGNPLYDWSFVSVPQPHENNRIIPIPRGKMLGGSSGLNGMAWNRASIPEYDAWSSFSRTSNWTWDGLLPFFKKTMSLETPVTNPYPGITDAAREEALRIIPTVDGFSGPISASHNPFYFDVVLTLAKTLNAIGIKTNLVPEGGNNLGMDNLYGSIDRKNGVRSYVAEAYYCPQSERKNLHVLTGAQVTKIHFRKINSGLQATGVDFSVNNQLYTVNTTKEVILSAGAVQTPQVLELSGIGNSSLLKSRGINPVLDLPFVGENLQEHLFIVAQWELKPGHDTFDLLRNNLTFAEEQMKLYNATRTGLYADLDSTLFFEPLQSTTSKERFAELIEVFDQESSKPGLSQFRKAQYSIQRQWLQQGNVAHFLLGHWNKGSIPPLQNKSYVALIGGITHPTSRGTIHIASSDPLASPVIDPQFLSQRFDELSLLESLKFLQRIMQQPPISNIVQVQTNPSPDMQSDEALVEYIRDTSAGGSHLMGTAVMAPRELGGVVDASLMVYGTQNLRVIDASIFPLHVAANTQATVYAIAEMAAAMIKKRTSS